MKRYRKIAGYYFALLCFIIILLPFNCQAAGREPAAVKKLLKSYDLWETEIFSDTICITCPNKNVSEKQMFNYTSDIVKLLKGELGKDYTEIDIHFLFTNEKWGEGNDAYEVFADEMFEFKECLNYVWPDKSCVDRLNLTAGSTTISGVTTYDVTIQLYLNGEDEEYNKKIQHIIAEGKRICGEDQVGLVQYFKRWLLDNVEYVPIDGPIVWGGSAYSAIVNGESRCEGFASALRDLCKMSDIPALTLTNESEMHAWNQIYLDGKWYTMDMLGVVRSNSGNDKYGLFDDPNIECDHPDTLEIMKKEMQCPTPFLSTGGMLEIKKATNLKKYIRNRANDSSLSFQSSNNSVVSVNQDGELTPNGKGTATITVSVSQQGQLYKLKQKVKSTVSNKGNLPKKGEKVEYKNGCYKITKAASTRNSSSLGGTVEFIKLLNSETAFVLIPDKIKVNDIVYEVVAVGKNALKNNKNVKKLKLGKNIKEIKKGAFLKCENLKSVTITSKKLSGKSIARNSFSGVSKKLKVHVPKSKIAIYKKLLRRSGMPKAAKVM